MSRILLYRPRRLLFKPYIADIEQYYDRCDTNNLNTLGTEIYHVAARYQRIDIIEKAAILTSMTEYYRLFYIGLNFSLEKLPYYITSLLGKCVKADGLLVSALFSGFIDVIYRYRDLYSGRYLLINEPIMKRKPLAMRAVLHLATYGSKIYTYDHMQIQIFRIELYIAELFPEPKYTQYVEKLARYIASRQ